MKSSSNRSRLRIVCLSAESVDILGRIGAGDLVIGVTAYAQLPKSWQHVPRVSGFSTANIQRIIDLEPDLVIGYSDVQASIAERLIQAGMNVLVTQQATLQEIENTILLLGRLVGKDRAAARLAGQFKSKIRRRTSKFRPRVYFEEWPTGLIDSPPVPSLPSYSSCAKPTSQRAKSSKEDSHYITGICWVSELVERAGGLDIFGQLRGRKRAKERMVTGEEVIRLKPDVIMASWCGKKVEIEQIRHRPCWEKIPAVSQGRIFEIDSTKILQPGPVVAEGFQEMCRILGNIQLC